MKSNKGEGKVIRLLQSSSGRYDLQSDAELFMAVKYLGRIGGKAAATELENLLYRENVPDEVIGITVSKLLKLKGKAPVLKFIQNSKASGRGRAVYNALAEYEAYSMQRRLEKEDPAYISNRRKEIAKIQKENPTDLYLKLSDMFEKETNPVIAEILEVIIGGMELKFLKERKRN